MALRGNLRDFSLPDVFQLVTFSRKTGVLRIVREDGAEGSVWFRDGDVFFASSNWHSDPLGERLVAAERITPQALQRALEAREKEPDNGRRLGQILIDEGYITEAILQSFVSDQIQDTIFDLMRWEEGDFDFEAMPDVVEEDIGLTVSIENLVMEGSRRLEEWGRIKKKIPSTDVVFKMATAPGEGTFEISLKPAEWELLLLIDGTRSVAELATYTGRTDFDVARVLYGLFSAGLLEFASEDEIAKNRAEREEREARLAEIMAERRAAEESEKREALAREEKLAEEARKRQAAAEAAAQAAVPSAPTAPSAQPAPERTEPAEEPSFLGTGVSAPSADDAAVLEAFMGAVLETPAPAAPEPVAPTSQPAPAAPYVPAEEPAFISVEHAEESDLTLVPVPSVEDLLGMTQEMPPVGVEQPAVDEIDAIAASFETTVPEVSVAEILPAEAAAEEQAPVAPTAQDVVAEMPAVPGTPEGPPAQDFERELMALGLGEMPADLLEPSAPEQPVSVVGPGAGADIEFEAPAVPMSELSVDSAWDKPADTGMTAELEGLVADLGLPGGAPPAPASEQPVVPEPLISSDDADFSALLESLDVDAAEQTAPPVASIPEPATVPQAPEESGFDADLFIDDEVTTGAISTDAYLEDIGMDEIGFSGGMTDELSALTGAERRQPSRPQASVNAIPEAGGVLQRDARVEKDTVLKIIDGIKNL